MSQPITLNDLPYEKRHAILHEAQEAAHQLMFNKAFFTKRELEKGLFEKVERHVGREVLAAVLPEVYERLALVPLFPNQPLNEWSSFTTARMIRLEREMVEMAKSVSKAHEIPNQPNAVYELVQAAFAARPTMADEQKAVVMASCVTENNVVITEGTAGAGKSFSLNAIREVYENIPPRRPGEQKGYDIIGTALSWTATKVLEESAGLTGGMAIEGFVRKIKEAKAKGQDFFKRRTLIVVDEAGLAPTELVHQILTGARESKQDVRVILTGDSLQLNPVQAGNALELLVEECGSTRLDTIRRQKQASHRQAVKHFCFGRAENGLYTYQQQEAIHFLKNKEEVMQKVVGDYVAYTSYFPEKSALVLALRNDDVAELNQQIRQAMKAVGRVASQGVILKTYDGKQVRELEFAVGDQIVFRQNAPAHPVFESALEKKALSTIAKKEPERINILTWVANQLKSNKRVEIRKGIFNRTIGTIVEVIPAKDKSNDLRILLAEGGETIINTKEYISKETQAVPIMHNFATTIYASQGQTVSKVLMLDASSINRKLAYVGASRHTELFDVYLDCNELGERIRKKITREREKAQQKITKEMQRSGGSLLSDLEDSRLYDQYPEYPVDHVFSKREYLGVVASSWNTPSLNQTVTMARKMGGRRHKRDPNWKSPLAPWFASIQKAAEDDWNDHPDTYHVDTPAAKITSSEQEVQVSRMLGLINKVERRVVVRAELGVPRQPNTKEVLGNDQQVADLEGVRAEALALTKGISWHLNRYADARLLAYDPHSVMVRAQYTLDGQCVVGDGEVPVFKNTQGNSQTPFLIVQDFREATIAYHYYREKYGADQKIVPHIVCAVSGAKLETLLPWLPPNPNVWVAHGKRLGSLDRAMMMAEQIKALGVTPEIKPPLIKKEKVVDMRPVRPKMG
jgi:hypothetical protein